MHRLGELLPEKLLSVGPHSFRRAVGELEQRGQQVAAELLGRFPWEERRQVVNGNHIQTRELWSGIAGQQLRRKHRDLQANSPNINSNGGLIKGGVDAIDGYGVVWVGGVAADINNDPQTPVLSGRNNGIPGDKVRDLRGEIDAVDEDVYVENLREGSALGGLVHIPLDDVVPGV